MSFYDWNIVAGATSDVHRLEQLRHAPSTTRIFWLSLANSGIYMLATVPPQIVARPGRRAAAADEDARPSRSSACCSTCRW